MKAYLKQYRQAPRKVRLVANTVRGRKVSTALENLAFVNKKAAHALSKLIRSAVANAKMEAEGLFVKEITVDTGTVYQRYRARARGTASPIKRETSNIKVVLGKK